MKIRVMQLHVIMLRKVSPHFFFSTFVPVVHCTVGIVVHCTVGIVVHCTVGIVGVTLATGTRPSRY
jgi:hypothetical protein